VTTDGHAAAPRPLVFGHRGARGLAPENTSAAFDRGVEAGADGLELDVRSTRDGEAVVCHDATLDRTTDASGPLSSFTARELASVDAGYRFRGANGGFPFRGRGLRLPMLRDVLARYRHPLIVELKDDSRDLARAVVALVQEAGAGPRVTIGSFHRAVVGEVRRVDPGIATGAATLEVRVALYGSWLGWSPPRPGYRALQVPERRGVHRVVSPRLVRAAHRSGVAVQVWVVDEPDRIRKLLGWGVDGIITDRPDVAVPVVREWREGR